MTLFPLGGHTFMTSTRRGSGFGGPMRMGEGGSPPCEHPHRKSEPTDVSLSSSHTKKLVSFKPEFRLWTE